MDEVILSTYMGNAILGLTPHYPGIPVEVVSLCRKVSRPRTLLTPTIRNKQIGLDSFEKALLEGNFDALQLLFPKDMFLLSMDARLRHLGTMDILGDLAVSLSTLEKLIKRSNTLLRHLRKKKGHPSFLWHAIRVLHPLCWGLSLMEEGKPNAVDRLPEDLISAYLRGRTTKYTWEGISFCQGNMRARIERNIQGALRTPTIRDVWRGEIGRSPLAPTITEENKRKIRLAFDDLREALDEDPKLSRDPPSGQKLKKYRRSIWFQPENETSASSPIYGRGGLETLVRSLGESPSEAEGSARYRVFSINNDADD